MGGTTAPFLSMCGIDMGHAVVAGHQVPELSPWLQKINVRMQKILCNYDEDHDGIDDRYQTDEYKEEESSHESQEGKLLIMGGDKSIPKSTKRTKETKAGPSDEEKEAKVKELRFKKAKEMRAWTDEEEDNEGKCVSCTPRVCTLLWGLHNGANIAYVLFVVLVCSLRLTQSKKKILVRMPVEKAARKWCRWTPLGTL